jgi:hypothetical protein
MGPARLPRVVGPPYGHPVIRVVIVPHSKPETKASQYPLNFIKGLPTDLLAVEEFCLRLYDEFPQGSDARVL